MLNISKNSNFIKIYRNAINYIKLNKVKRKFCSQNQKLEIGKFYKKFLIKTFLRLYFYVSGTKNRINFDTFVTHRQSEARKSILVQVSSEKSYDELQKYCSQFGVIISAHYYNVPEDDSHYILIEYRTSEEASTCMNACIFNQDVRGIPTKSQFLWFRTGPKIKTTKAIENANQINIVNGNLRVREEDMISWLSAAENLKDQIKILHNSTMLSDLGTRLRFLAAQQLQNAVTGMFPEAYAHPFGSSVNGFGKEGCDLDLVLRLDSGKSEIRDSRLVFHTKSNLNNPRTQTQRYMEGISDMIQLFLPGVNNVRRILSARVPIVKYNHDYLDLEVDLSMSNL